MSHPQTIRGAGRRTKRAAVKAFFLVMVVGLAVVGGMALTRFDMAPYEMVKGAAKQTLSIVAIAREIYAEPSDSAAEMRTKERVPTEVRDRGRAQPGLTLVSAAGGAAFLIDLDGRIVHRWQIPVAELVSVPFKLPATMLTISSMHVLPDGSLIALLSFDAELPVFKSADAVTNTVLVKLDKDSRLIWSFADRPHHTFDVADDGSVYALVIADRKIATSDAAVSIHSLNDEGIAFISPEGKELRRIWFSDAFLKSDYAGLMTTIRGRLPWCLSYQYDCSDVFHSNSVQIIDAAAAKAFPRARAGDFLVNFRNLSTVAVIGRDTGAVRWAAVGPWRGAHDARLSDDGTMTIFDNLGDLTPGGTARVLRIDPVDMRIVWSFGGTREAPMESAFLGSVRSLENGNVLVTVALEHRVAEVAPDHKIVWQYSGLTPGAPERPFEPALSDCQRIDPATLPFLPTVVTAAPE